MMTHRPYPTSHIDHALMHRAFCMEETAWSLRDAGFISMAQYYYDRSSELLTSIPTHRVPRYTQSTP